MTDKDNELQNDQMITNWQHRNHKVVFGLIILIVLVIVFMFGVGAGRMSTRLNQFVRTDGRGQAITSSNRNYSSGFGFTTNMPIVQSSVNQIEITGVVTAINGDKVTLVGGGVSNIITTNSSTQYVNGSSLAVNDSADIIGQYSNNVLTATIVTINP